MSMVRKAAKKRRPAGVSRSEKHRRLQFESLEARQVMSANTIVDYTAADAAIRYQMLDNEVLNSWERAANLARYTQEQLATATQWVILADLGSDLADEIAAGGFTLDGPTGIIPGAMYVSPGEGGVDLMVDALRSSTDIDYFYPLIEYSQETQAVTNDPYLVNQWHLINFGQLVGGSDFGFLRGTPDEDINIEGAWDVATGKGVQIAVVDTGVAMNHPDLVDNILEDMAVSFIGSGAAIDPHGTAVAGLIAGVGNNGTGITGVAYEADIVPIRLIGNFGLTDSTLAQALLYQFQTIDVYNHSWGLVDPTGNTRTINDFGPLATTAIRNSVFFGRGGLGTIHVFSSGNDGGSGTTSNYSGLTNSRYTIAVTGVDHSGAAAGGTFGLNTAYPEGGSNVLIAAPTGSVALEIIRDTGLGSGIWTTDFVGNDGYNISADENGLELDNDYFPDTDYTSRFSGTSAAAPLVSGVIGLMLEVNPNLTYRDVQHILVRSARQNDPTDASWIVNSREFQLDPLPPVDLFGTGYFDPASRWPFEPAYAIDQLPLEWTNGAGFTVSQAYGNYSISGYAHGVVDATMAVELAKNWQTVGGQQSEFTWTTGNTIEGKVWAAHISSDETGEFLVPGGITGDGDGDKTFGSYYDEFGDETPFVDDEGEIDDDPPFNDREGGVTVFGLQAGIPLSPPPMTVEWVEVQLNLGGDLNDINQLRISLVSPDGTVSELNAYGQDRPNNVVHFDGIGSFGPHDNMGTTSFVLTTNRHWGERTEAKMRMDDNGVPILDALGNPILDGWRLVFENYGDGDVNIGSYNVTFHGQNAVGTARVQGAIGVDDNADGVFSDIEGAADNFKRYIEVVADPDDPTSVFRVVNPGQESWAAGVIVYVDLNQDGKRDSIEPWYQTGNDGNYYFDLPDGTYDIRIDETALPEGLNNAQNMAIGLAGPITTITVDLTPDPSSPLALPNVRYTPFEMAADPTVAALNLVLIPDAPTTVTTFDISGFVYADLNEDGVLNGDDSGIAGAQVYLDVNQNGIFDPTIDKFTTTAGDGSYSFTGVTAPVGFYSVIVFEGTTGTFIEPTMPSDFEQGVFVRPGFVVENINFGFKGIEEDEEPGGGGGIDPNTPGAISGVVFLDNNNTGVREGEPGAAGVTVYIDANGDNMYNVGEQTSITGENGAYQFNNLAPGSVYVVRIVTPAAFSLTGPPGGEYSEFISTAEVVTGKNFGIRSLATHDYGDLPDSFGATTGPNAARHALGSPFFLGATVDGELTGTPSEDAEGDNLIGADEDGVVFASTVGDGALTNLATTWHFDVTANTTGGYLHAWADFDGSGTFEPSERLTLKSSAVPTGSQKLLLQAGVNELYVDVPPSLANNNTGYVYIRFRYGEIDIDSFMGPANVGEVEDYRVPILAINPGLQIVNGPDFNNDGSVDGRDFMAWQRGFGITSGATHAQGDANNDGKVDGADLQMWKDKYGSSSGNLAAMVAGNEEHGPTYDPAWLQSHMAAQLARIAEYQAYVLATSVPVEPSSAPSAGASQGQSAGPSSPITASSVEASALASTLNSLQPTPVALGASSDESLDVEDIDHVFTGSAELSAFIAARFDSSDRQTSARYLRGDDDRSEDEDDALALAFADADDWRQF